MTVTQPVSGPERTWSNRFVLTVIGAVALLTLDAVTPMGLAIWLLQVVLMWTTSLWATPTQIRITAVLCSVFTILAFCWSEKAGLAGWIGVTNLLLSVGAVCAIAHTSLRQRVTEKARREAADQAAESEAKVKILTGLLPICSSCKKIRNEGGEWEQLEIYISSHSQALFSHGICRPCVTKLYPDLSLEAEEDVNRAESFIGSPCNEP